MFAISQLWKGEIPLCKTFWLYGLLGNTILSLAMLLTVGLSSVYKSLLGYFAVLLIVLIAIIYQGIIYGGLWRSADNYTGNPLWKYLAKWIAVLGIFSIIIEISNFIPK